MKEFIIWNIDSEELLTLSDIKENPNLELQWDYEKNCIALVEFNSGDGWTPERGEFNDTSWEKLNIEIFPYIRNTHVSKQKIYEDCSILKVNYFDGSDWMSDYGFFSWDDENLRYVFTLINENELIPYEDYSFELLEVVDTIQENKLKLVQYYKDEREIDW